jgi:gamma-D-glutamyl-L-lysine dipeptidyl-peptidase
MEVEQLSDLQVTHAVVAVPVTAAWANPDAPRPADSAVTQPVPDMAAWMASLTHELRLDLLGRISTSALLGEPVVVVGERNGWSEVRLPWQPTAADPRGYPAWIPSAHLAPSSTRNSSVGNGIGSRTGGDGGAAVVGSGEADVASGEPSVFCVTRRLVPVRASRGGAPVQVLSLGTRLPVVDVDPATGTSHAQVQVSSPMGTFWVDADCGVYAVASAPTAFVGRQISDGKTAGELEDVKIPALLAAGSELLGLAYLWGGLSGWGVDCSGLVHLAHRVLGLVVPRDSVDQHAVFGSVVGEPKPGQAVFFRYRNDSQRIHHVGLAVSDATMLHAPKTGRVVEFLPVATEPYGSELQREATSS